ncbi:MAG: hypothetical protein ACQEP8_02710 [Chlamydiota bacterium]
MERIKTLATQIWQDTRRSAHKQIPLLECCYERHSEGTYQARCERGVITLKADNLLDAAYGAYQLSAGALSGYLGEYLGGCSPRYPLRPLWLVGSGRKAITNSLTISWPEFVKGGGDIWKQVCLQVIRLGYNAIVFGGHGTRFVPQEGDFDISHLVDTIRSYGLQVIFKLELNASHYSACCPLEEEYAKLITTAIREMREQDFKVDYILWEGTALGARSLAHPTAVDATSYELALAEVKLLENNLEEGEGLIYYLPAKDYKDASSQAVWIERLADDMGPTTILAFSMVAGDPQDLYLTDHPLWQQIRYSSYRSATPLMPIVNIGKVGCGEGLWPDISLQSLQRCRSQMERHNFAGMMIMSKSVPNARCLLDCSLWVAGQSQWYTRSVEMLVDTWFKAYRPSLDYLKVRESFKTIEDIVIKLSGLQKGAEDSAMLKIKGEELLARLKIVQEEALNQVGGIVGEYSRYFVPDARRIIHQVFKSAKINIPGVLSGSDFGEGFWTKIEGSTKEFAGQVKAHILEEPYPGDPKSGQNKIYQETYPFCF